MREELLSRTPEVKESGREVDFCHQGDSLVDC